MNDNIIPPEPPTNQQEWFWYVKYYEKSIFVREKNADGKWDSVSLADLPPNLWAKHVYGWIEGGYRIPCRIIVPEESGEMHNEQ